MKTFLAFTTGLLSGFIVACGLMGALDAYEEESKEEAEEVEA